MPAYISVADADTYFSTRPYSNAWVDATPDQKAAALEMATISIDNLLLKGRRYLFDQEHEFPREYELETFWITDPEAPQGLPPMRVKWACAEEALALLEYGNSSRLKLRQQGVKSFRLGGTGLQEDYIPYDKGQLLSPRAQSLMKPFIANAVPYGGGSSWMTSWTSI